MTTANDSLAPDAPFEAVRAGWAEAAQDIAIHDDDTLVVGEFGNADDVDLTW